jgi:hypothetical protein
VDPWVEVAVASHLVPVVGLVIQVRLQRTSGLQEPGWSLRQLGQRVADCFEPNSLRGQKEIGMPLSAMTRRPANDS